jgi:hypothetical protein
MRSCGRRWSPSNHALKRNPPGIPEADENEENAQRSAAMKNDVLNRELEEAARALLDEVARRRRTGGLPVHIVRRLVRGPGVGEFDVAEEENPDWSAALAQACTAVSSEVLSAASDQALHQGLVSDEPTSGSADRVCGSVLVPVLARYVMLAGERDEFDPELFAACLKELRANRGADRVPMVALAPLHNLTSSEDEIELADDLAIVRITDGDRNDLLTQFGDWFKAPFAPARLLWWTMPCAFATRPFPNWLQVQLPQLETSSRLCGWIAQGRSEPRSSGNGPIRLTQSSHSLGPERDCGHLMESGNTSIRPLIISSPMTWGRCASSFAHCVQPNATCALHSLCVVSIRPLSAWRPRID